MNLRRLAGFYLMSLCLIYLVIVTLETYADFDKIIPTALIPSIQTFVQVFFWPFFLLQNLLCNVLSYLSAYMVIQGSVILVNYLPALPIFFLGWILWRTKKQ
jgi:hypothetical protein